MLADEVNKIDTNWKEFILEFKDELNIISSKIEEEKTLYEPSLQILPSNDKIFKAFKYFDIKDLKLVFIGQDCYHGRGQANGLCFSVPNDISHPPSLKNIIKEMSDDIGLERKNSDFTDLAEQGILFLNSALSVREKCPESHTPIWNKFTDDLLKKISDNTDKVIFVLWGNFAKGKKNFIDGNKHCILESVHPSPLAAWRGFFGCKHFSKINEKLKEWNKKEIKWVI
jgi:uracil-DNA glycosylase